MKKTILITGSTDGIGYAAAQTLLAAGHTVLLHGRSAEKLAAKAAALTSETPAGTLDSFLCDLTRMSDVAGFAASVAEKYSSLDVLLNNAGILKTPNPWPNY